ncbi:MAG: hypothetical protein P1U88_03140 [Thalassobaculaceae bacterium]|nr:hypothetical protein [Thalassobaculaceae bacterium]
MRNFLLIAGPVTDPNRFMTELGRHPDIAALPPVTLGNALHAVARRAVDAASGGPRTGDALLALAREQGGAALASYFSSLRTSTGRPAVVLYDPSGPMFPLLNPPGIDLLLLTRDPEAVARAVGAGAMPQVIDAARKALDAFERRVAGFGVDPERIHTVDEGGLREAPAAVWPEICRMLDVDDEEQTIAGMIRPMAAPWSLRGGLI